MSTIPEFNAQAVTAHFGNCLALTKPRVTALIVFTAVIGMFLATPGMVPLNILLAATVGIGMSSGAAAAFNHLVEQKIDAKMARTRGRPLPTGQMTSKQTLLFSTVMAELESERMLMEAADNDVNAYFVDALNFVSGHFGSNSLELEKAGGTPTSKRKNPTKARMINKLGKDAKQAGV